MLLYGYMRGIKVNIESTNSLVLAYLGDSVYEIYIRSYLINKGDYKVNDLQHLAIDYVSAVSQSKYLKMFMDKNILTDVELDVVMRARNHKGNRHPKNTDIVTYKLATGLEALFGYLFLEKRYDRIKELMDLIVGE